MQNLQLLLHIPDLSSHDANTAVSWHLFDRRSVLLRAGAGTLDPAGTVPRAERTVIVIPARRSVCIETPLPPVSAQKRDALLRYAIEDKLTIDPATVHAVVLGVSASPESNLHVVVAIERSWLAGVLRWLRDAGIEPAQAVAAASLIPVANDEWAVVLDGAHGLARRPDGFSYSFDIAKASNSPGELASKSPDIPLEPPFALALALKEARDGQASPLRLSVLVEQPDAAADAPWVAAWQRALGCPVRVAARPVPRMVTAEAGNLLSADFAPRQAGGGWLRWSQPALAVAASIAILQLTFTVIDAGRLDQRRRALEAEMTQVFKAAFPTAQAIVDPPLQMQRNLDAMKREAGLGAADEARLLLAQLTAIVRSVPALVPASVTIRDGAVSVEAPVPDRQQQSTLQRRVAGTPGATFGVDANNLVRLDMKAAR